MLRKFSIILTGLFIFLVSCGKSDNSSDNPVTEWPEPTITATETTLIPMIDTKEVSTTIKITNESSVNYVIISKVGADQYSEKISGNSLNPSYPFKYVLTNTDPEQFSFVVMAYSKNGTKTSPLYIKIDNRKGMFINSVTRIARITGNPMVGENLPSPNNTAIKWNVGGTDLGIIWEMNPGKYGMFFGDTFGADFKPNNTSPGPNGTSWRSNVLAFSEDIQLEDGLTFSGMATDNAGKAREIVYGAKDTSGFGDWTSIPTAAIRANGTDYVHYMNIRNWTGWVTNYSSLYKSTDNGVSWTICSTVKFSEDSHFGQVGYFKKDGYVYMIGTETGRSGSAYLSRFKETDIENQHAYEYWNNQKKQWIQGDENQATIVIPGTVGELSFIYNESFKKWIIAYFNSEKYNISLRSADDITGPWSEDVELASGYQYPQLYGSFFHPLSVNGRNLYFSTSMWLPYNTFLMKVELGGMGK